MKKVMSLIIVLSMCLSLCACGSSSPAIKDEETAPHIVETKKATVEYVGYQFDDDSLNILHVNFKYNNTGDDANSLHFTVQIKAYQDGKELHCHMMDGVSDDILPGYDNTCTYSFILDSMESPVLIQYSSWGISKVISEFTIDIASNEN